LEEAAASWRSEAIKATLVEVEPWPHGSSVRKERVLSEKTSRWLDPLISSKFADALGTIALSYLIWRPRIEKAERAMRSLPATLPLHRYPGDSALSRADSAFAPDKVLRSHFVDEFLRDHRDWTKEDADAAIELSGSKCTSLTDWIDVIVRAFGVELEFDYEEPQVAIATSVGWRALTDLFDPDAVACYLLARAGHADEIDKLNNWGAATRVSDRDLAAILDEGVTDLHLHLGGARNAQILWRNLLSGDIALDRVNRYSLQSLNELAATNEEEHTARIAERDRVLSVIDMIADPASPLGSRWDAFCAVSGPAGENERRIGEALLRERAMMSRAWRDLRDRLDTPQRELHAKLQLEHHLDRYLFAKNLFLANHRQPERSNPGLGVFRQYYRSVEPIWPSGKLAPIRLERSRRVQIREYAEYAAYIAQSRSLRRVELRLGPLERPRAYHQFFGAWSQVEKEFKIPEKGVDIRFAVHFKRSLNARKSAGSSGDDPAPAAAPLRWFLRELDRDSAVLHTYRTGEEWAEHSWRIARIDFAGSERDIPPDAASFCMNLVRGDPDALTALAGQDCDKELHRFWLLHAERGTAGPPRGRPGVGITCHAGEDYAHPLEGTYCIASAAKLFRMGAGDTIGHGLALGHDCASYDQIRSPKSLTVRGLQFDALLWLYGRCQERMDTSTLSLLEPWLRQEAYELYGEAALCIQSPANMERSLFEQRCRPVPMSDSTPSEPCAKLRHMELWHIGCSANRSQRVPIAEIVYRMVPAIESVQKLVLTQLAEKGIALEFNPSSNLRVSRSLAPRDIPFMRILRDRRAHVLATINTDDPGTFGTRIENEYALVMRALVEADFTRAEALGVVRRLRDVGRQFVYWPPLGVDRKAARAEQDAQ
jgi:hypothetical protein